MRGRDVVSFSHQDATVAARTASALDRHERLRHRVWHPTHSRVRLLTELSLLADETGHDVYVRQATIAVAEHVGGACVIALRRGASHVFSVASHVSQGRALLAHPVPFAEMARYVLQTGRGLFMEAGDAGEQAPAAHFFHETAHGDQALVVPLRTHGQVTGALGAVTSAHVSADDVRYLHEVCARIAITVEYLRLDSGDGSSAAAPVEAATAPVPAPVPLLSARERQVLACVAAGMTSREAAAQLCISRRTVEWHRERIKEKLGVSGRVALTRAAREAGLEGPMV